MPMFVKKIRCGDSSFWKNTAVGVAMQETKEMVEMKKNQDNIAMA